MKSIFFTFNIQHISHITYHMTHIAHNPWVSLGSLDGVCGMCFGVFWRCSWGIKTTFVHAIVRTFGVERTVKLIVLSTYSSGPYYENHNGCI